MPLLQVREMPAPLYEILREDARAHKRSVAKQTVVILEQHLLGGAADSQPVSNSNNRERRKLLLADLERFRADCISPEAANFALEANIRAFRDNDRINQIELQ